MNSHPTPTYQDDATRRPDTPTLPLEGYGMHTSDSLFVASGVKSVSHQNHLDRMWQLVMAHRGCLDNPLKESRFSRCVNPLALEGEGRRACNARRGGVTV